MEYFIITIFVLVIIILFGSIIIDYKKLEKKVFMIESRNRDSLKEMYEYRAEFELFKEMYERDIRFKK